MRFRIPKLPRKVSSSSSSSSRASKCPLVSSASETTTATTITTTSTHRGSLNKIFYSSKCQSLQISACVKRNSPSKYHMCVMQRLYSASSTADDEDIEQKSELMKKVGWLIKILAAATITYVSFNMYPIMGDSLIWQSVALVRLDDPFMKRSGASRISLIATNDRRRKGFVEAGGVTELTKMLKSASDEKTQLEAVKALVALCECGIVSC